MVVEGGKAKWDTLIPHFLKPRKSQDLKWVFVCFCCCLCCTIDNFNKGNALGFKWYKIQVEHKVLLLSWNSCFFATAKCFFLLVVLAQGEDWGSLFSYFCLFPLFCRKMPLGPYFVCILLYSTVGCLDKKKRFSFHLVLGGRKLFFSYGKQSRFSYFFANFLWEMSTVSVAGSTVE